IELQKYNEPAITPYGICAMDRFCPCCRSSSRKSPDKPDLSVCCCNRPHCSDELPATAQRVHSFSCIFGILRSVPYSHRGIAAVLYRKLPRGTLDDYPCDCLLGHHPVSVSLYPPVFKGRG